MITPSDNGYTADGFPGQRMRVVPRPLVQTALGRPTSSRLLVTDCGYFPHAAKHGRIRRHGLKTDVIIACTAGRGSYRISGEEHPVTAGQVLVIPRDTPHSYRADEDDPWTIWWIHVAGSDVADLLGSARVTAERPLLAVPDIHRVAGLVDEIIGRLEQDETERTLLGASGAAWHLLALLGADQAPLDSRSDPVSEAQNYLRARIGTRISVGELAALVGLSPSHFSALFRAKTGTGVVEYQTRLRMGVARELLDMTDRTIEQTARAVGYPDSFYFSRQFRTIHGMSPSEYRARTKAEAQGIPQ
ncbi:AraC family transcriptional regulator [Compostimonas suwonensis]|uniref:AraC-like protein n=1 Tax=Compostimonas suwonensis TaxID=1048394 RepID=A0A2M9BWG0_9MICO|nr:AraC family transcriptional regulator [Compostimonas suwonensis]PJJ62293.1 AraC-like protein [Compostimonas suwonensis]